MFISHDTYMFTDALRPGYRSKELQGYNYDYISLYGGWPKSRFSDPPFPRLSGVVRKLIPPSPAGRPTFWFTMEWESPQTHAHALKHMITYSQTPENSNFHTHAWILIKITKKERIIFFQFRTSEHLKPPSPHVRFCPVFPNPPSGGRPDVLYV